MSQPEETNKSWSEVVNQRKVKEAKDEDKHGFVKLTRPANLRDRRIPTDGKQQLRAVVDELMNSATSHKPEQTAAGPELQDWIRRRHRQVSKWLSMDQEDKEISRSHYVQTPLLGGLIKNRARDRIYRILITNSDWLIDTLRCPQSNGPPREAVVFRYHDAPNTKVVKKPGHAQDNVWNQFTVHHHVYGVPINEIISQSWLERVFSGFQVELIKPFAPDSPLHQRIVTVKLHW